MRMMSGVLVLALCMSLVVVPVGAADYTIDIFGNANMDDTIDELDVEYVQGIIDGTNDETDLSDANYDGAIDEEDIAQIELIIDGEEKERTLIDMAGRVVTIPQPIERVVPDSMDTIRTFVALDASDLIVGVPYSVDRMSEVYNYIFIISPKLDKLPRVSTREAGVNTELIVSLKPDVIFASSTNADTLQEQTGLPVVCVSTAGSLDFEIYRLVGAIIGKEEEADELISYANEKIAEVSEITSEIPDSEKPKVYLAYWAYEGTITHTPSRDDPLDMAGGLNVAKEAGIAISGLGNDYEVSKENIIAWNPDVILVHRGTHQEEVTLEGLVYSDSDLQGVNAVKSHDVYCTIGYMYGWDPVTGICEVFYEAKLLHPDKFEDLDVDEVGNEILKRFYKVDDLYTYISKELELHTWE
jgi:iron complex transport system substrate-binding protein